MASVSFLPAAQLDYDEALAWYAERSLRAASGFEAAVERTIRQIADAPDRWPHLGERHRFHLVQRYPYYVVYRIEVGMIVVVAIAHGRRRLRYWKNR
jgi:plasmid stabilization system protein ParE